MVPSADLELTGGRALMQAAIMLGEAGPALEDVLVLRVLASSLGIRQLSGQVAFVLPRNATIPTKREVRGCPGTYSYHLRLGSCLRRATFGASVALKPTLRFAKALRSVFAPYATQTSARSALVYS